METHEYIDNMDFDIWYDIWCDSHIAILVTINGYVENGEDRIDCLDREYLVIKKS